MVRRVIKKSLGEKSYQQAFPVVEPARQGKPWVWQQQDCYRVPNLPD